MAAHEAQRHPRRGGGARAGEEALRAGPAAGRRQRLQDSGARARRCPPARALRAGHRGLSAARAMGTPRSPPSTATPPTASPAAGSRPPRPASAARALIPRPAPRRTPRAPRASRPDAGVHSLPAICRTSPVSTRPGPSSRKLVQPASTSEWTQSVKRTGLAIWPSRASRTPGGVMHRPAGVVGHQRHGGIGDLDLGQRGFQRVPDGAHVLAVEGGAHRQPHRPAAGLGVHELHQPVHGRGLARHHDLLGRVDVRQPEHRALGGARA